MKMIKNSLPLIAFSMLLFANENGYKIQEQIIIYSGADERPVFLENLTEQIIQTREEIDLFIEDFESDAEGWNVGSGWQLSDQDFNSPNHSMNSPNDATTNDGLWNLVSPTYTLPALGDGETMHFGFYIKGDTPDTDGDGDDYLDDYYFVSILDVDALVWHPSPTGSFDGNSYWCGEEILSSGGGGYLSEWLQFLDTPSFLVPNGGTLSADMKWALEPAAGASVSGTCVDGWDAANVRISNDNGLTWNLLTSTIAPYDFDCGNGWIYHNPEYDTGGSLHHLAPGWGDARDWDNISFDISEYSGQEVIVRFAFGSDGGWCTLDDPTATGFQVDNIVVSGALDCSPETECAVVASGEAWVDQFYDYCDDVQPGGLGWTEYLPGYPFNGNVFMDISDFSEKDVVFRFQTKYDDNDDGGAGTGLWIDDFRVYKISGGNYPAPWDLAGEGLNNEASLTWADMNAQGTDDFIFDNDGFDPNNSIYLNGDDEAWAAERFDIAGTSSINSVDIHSINDAAVDVTIGAFGQVGTLFAIEPMYSQTVTLQPGWNTVDVSGWDMNNSFLIGYTFSATVNAGLDGSDGGNSMVMLGGGWDDWMETALSAGLPTGEWGVRANITYEGAGVLYNIYRDGLAVANGLDSNSYSDTDVDNNVTYIYAVSATYSDGEESDSSESIEITPQAQTVHEEFYDDGSAESFFNAGSGNFTAVGYHALEGGEDLVRFKWFQENDGGAFYLKLYNDNVGIPGDEFYSRVMASGLVAGWNTYDLSGEGLSVTEDFWVGIKEFSSTQPFGVDTDSEDGNDYTRVGSDGDWIPIDGNLMIRVFLDCGENCDDGEEPQCTAGDINADGIINVLDIVSTVNFVMGVAIPTEDEGCAADFNQDGIINVLDIVQLVNIIINN